MRVQAIWNGVVIAESEKTILLEGNHYFPPDAIHNQYFKSSEMHTICPWKGTASYYDVEVDGQVNRGAAWYYPDPSAAAREIKGYIAFWRGVQVRKAEAAEGEMQPKEGFLKRILS